MSKYSPEFGLGLSKDYSPDASPADGNRWEQFFKRNKEAIQKSLVKIVGASVFLSASIIEPYKAVAQQMSFTKESVASRSIENSGRKQERQIQREILTDERERVFVELDEEFYELNEGKARNAFIDYEDLYDFMEAHSARHAYIAHTHPKETYIDPLKKLSYSQERIDGILSAHELPPEPPSMMDFSAQYGIQNHFKPKGMDLRGKVIDPEGNWVFTVADNNHLFERLQEVGSVMQQSLVKNLTKGEWNTIRKVMETGTVDPRELSSYLQSLPKEEDRLGEKKKLGQKLDNLEKEVMQGFNQEMDVYEKVEKLALAVMTSPLGPEREKAIADYVGYCSRNGINVSYNKAN